jgi:hypothetical protein
MPVYGSDNVAALSNNASVIVFDGSIQNSQQQASVGTLIISESPQCPQTLGNTKRGMLFA